MKQSLLGVHHITTLASNPQRNVDFYTDALGLRLVKKTVNFDSPDVYHLYYGDEMGSPGTILTFFPFEHAARGQRGSGEIAAVAFNAPEGSQDFWIKRLSSMEISFEGSSERLGEEMLSFLDPDGMIIELVFQDADDSKRRGFSGPVPIEFALTRLQGATFWVQDPLPTERLLVETLGFEHSRGSESRERYAIGGSHIDVVPKPGLSRGRQSAGSVHHIAWRVESDEGQQRWRQTIAEEGLTVTEILDRKYFRSIYFREPGGILYEIATDPPGFTVDETEETLGSTLKLPDWLESTREQLERQLPRLKVRTSYQGTI